jgi:hypothetical protein
LDHRLRGPIIDTTRCDLAFERWIRHSVAVSATLCFENSMIFQETIGFFAQLAYVVLHT